jgi:mono/diheme cytochrome c family protein
MVRHINCRACLYDLARLVLIGTVFLQIAFAAESAPDQEANSAAVEEGQRDESTSVAAAPYAVECGQVNDAGEPFCYVDPDTYIGWRTFHGNCHVCHAQDAVGSTFAPNLLDRMQDFDFDTFVERTANGYTGQVGVMPAWKDNPNVNKKYKELFAYLKARSDGVLPPGRPKKKSQKK